MIMPCASRARVVLRSSISTGLKMARWLSTGTSFNRSRRRPPIGTAYSDRRDQREDDDHEIRREQTRGARWFRRGILWARSKQAGERCRSGDSADAARPRRRGDRIERLLVAALTYCDVCLLVRFQREGNMHGRADFKHAGRI